MKLNYQSLFQNEKLLFESYIDKVYSLLNFDGDKTGHELGLGSSINSSSSLSIIDQVTEHNPEFMEFLLKKHTDKTKPPGNIIQINTLAPNGPYLYHGLLLQKIISKIKKQKKFYN